jgi:transcriptional regulator with XRE-family HTH domain
MLLGMAFPAQLAQTRKQRGLTQEALGELVGLTKLQIYRYEKGSSQPTLDVLKKIAINLNTSIDALVFNEDERGPSDDLKLRFEQIQQIVIFLFPTVQRAASRPPTNHNPLSTL